MEVLKSNFSARDGGVVQAIQRAGQPGQGGGGDEGHHLILGDVDAHGLGGDAVVADGHDGAAGAAVDQVQHDEQRDQDQDEAR